MDIYREFNFLFGQSGSSILVDDRSDWESGELTGWEEATTAVIMVDTADELSFDLDTLNPTDKRFTIPVNVGEEHHIRMYALRIWEVGTNVIANEVYWYNSLAWVSQNAGILDVPALSNPQWEVLDESNLTTLDHVDAGVVATDGYASTVLSSPLGDFAVTKVEDHKFRITNYTGSDIDEVTIADYRTEILSPQPSMELSTETVDITFSEDGVYVAIIDIGTEKHYIEIYDFTDTEDCYISLVQKVMCECVDCEDCTSPVYNRALTFLNIYQMVKDIVYTDRYVYSGMASTESLRTDTLTELGTLVDKLKLMAENCTCSE